MEKKNETQQPQTPEEIKETDLTVQKDPWWKIGLKILSYVATGAAALVVGLVIGGRDDDQEEVTDNTQE